MCLPNPWHWQRPRRCPVDKAGSSSLSRFVRWLTHDQADWLFCGKAPKKEKKEEAEEDIAFKEKKKAEAEALKAAREKGMFKWLNPRFLINGFTVVFQPWRVSILMYSDSACADCLRVGGPLVGGGIKKCVYHVEHFNFNLIFYYLHRSGKK